MTTAERWATETSVTLPRYALERAIDRLDDLEALALIRSAYGATLPEAREVLTGIRHRGD